MTEWQFAWKKWKKKQQQRWHLIATVVVAAPAMAAKTCTRYYDGSSKQRALSLIKAKKHHCTGVIRVEPVHAGCPEYTFRWNYKVWIFKMFTKNKKAIFLDLITTSLSQCHLLRGNDDDLGLLFTPRISWQAKKILTLEVGPLEWTLPTHFRIGGF